MSFAVFIVFETAFAVSEAVVSEAVLVFPDKTRKMN